MSFDWKLEVIKDTISEYDVINAGHADAESMVKWIEDLYQMNLVYILGDRASQTVIVVFHKRPFVGDAHFYTKSKSVWEVSACLRRAIDWVFSNTPLKKIEGDLTNPSLVPLCIRAGMSAEGTRPKSYYKKDEMVDMYNVGIVKE